jgi:hypothetical protein
MKSKPMVCAGCGATMNHHAEKLIEPRDAEEAARVDVRWGGTIEEVHECPGCGATQSRPGT